jgi:hypothetical protein
VGAAPIDHHESVGGRSRLAGCIDTPARHRRVTSESACVVAARAQCPPAQARVGVGIVAVLCCGRTVAV